MSNLLFSDEPIARAETLREKRDLRRAMRLKRKMLQATTADASTAVCDKFLTHITLPKSSCVAGYIAQNSELDPSLLLDALHRRGHRVALPVVHAKGEPLLFRHHENYDALVTNSMGILEPCETAQLVEPDVVIIPFLAFDQRGYRLGYGGGYYDRTLRQLRQHAPVIAIGIGFAGQEVSRLPVASFDEKLNKIITESTVFSFEI